MSTKIRKLNIFVKTRVDIIYWSAWAHQYPYRFPGEHLYLTYFLKKHVLVIVLISFQLISLKHFVSESSFLLSSKHELLEYSKVTLSVLQLIHCDRCRGFEPSTAALAKVG